jgi:hypothetical protein
MVTSNHVYADELTVHEVTCMQYHQSCMTRHSASKPDPCGTADRQKRANAKPSLVLVSSVSTKLVQALSGR